MIITLVAAIAKNWVIGKDNSLPWHIPADLKRFKILTLGKPVIMGRRTFESIGKPLPKRINIVLSWQKDLPEKENLLVATSIPEALKIAKNFGQEAIIAGGAQVYKQFLPLAQRMHLTLIEKEFEGDTFFPQFNLKEWKVVKVKSLPPNPETPYPLKFLTLQRKNY